ncbi:MAG: hypothetical protein H6606_07890 [Flavobacteriales bacterium]|nr:hypothetical protein [Flavobacteriales bacterium]
MLSTLYTMFLYSCKETEEDENELRISFKTENGYTFQNEVLPGGAEFKVGIKAETEKVNDPLIRFNISESVNNGSDSSIYTEDLKTQSYQHDHVFRLSDTIPGNTHEYTFTITNRDGKLKQLFLNVTVD